MNPTDILLDPANSVGWAQQATITAFLNKVFQAVIDFLFTIVNILVNFFTQPAVLGALATILVIYWAYRMLKNKSTSM